LEGKRTTTLCTPRSAGCTCSRHQAQALSSCSSFSKDTFQEFPQPFLLRKQELGIVRMAVLLGKMAVLLVTVAVLVVESGGRGCGKWQ
jgi:hypothetical protein